MNDMDTFEGIPFKRYSRSVYLQPLSEFQGQFPLMWIKMNLDEPYSALNIHWIADSKLTWVVACGVSLNRLNKPIFMALSELIYCELC